MVVVLAFLFVLLLLSSLSYHFARGAFLCDNAGESSGEGSRFITQYSDFQKSLARSQSQQMITIDDENPFRDEDEGLVRILQPFFER